MKETAQPLPRRIVALRVIALLAVIAITIFIYSIRDQAEQLQAYGYPGIFILSLLSNATIILPAPGLAITFAAGGVFDPFWVGIAAGAGAALGELTGYLAGFSGQGVLEGTKVYERMEDLTRRYGNWTVLFLAIIPNPFFDVAGAAAGALRMPVSTFLLWATIGKIIKMWIFAYAGALSVDWLFQLLG